MPLLYEVDSDGFYVKDVFIPQGETLPDSLVSVQPPQPCIKPRWDGIEWVEENPDLLPTPEKLAQNELESWRNSARVSAFQAQAALTQAGFMPEIEAHLADPDTDPLTKLAWAKAQEFRRMSYTVLEFAEILGIAPLELDDLFRFGKTIEA